MIWPVEANIDLKALQHNFNVVKQKTSANVIAMVKANAYGHGVISVANALNHADAFGVARLSGAINLETHDIKTPIIVMEGFFDSKECETISAHGFQTVVHHAFQIDILNKVRLKQPMVVWLKLETGMHRLGLNHNVMEVIQSLQHNPNVKELRLLSHFSDAEVTDSDITQHQIDRFHQLTQDFDVPKSLANSAGLLAWPQSHLDWVRPGIMLYGISPFSDRCGAELGCKPVMTLSSQLLAINDCVAGDRIGYNGTWTCPEAMRVGVVAIGYGDGYPRHAENGTPVWVAGKEVPLVGRVSMDMITVDLRTHPEAKIGDKVILWGNELPIERIAKCSNTIAYELVCGITRRVKYTKRSFVNEA